MATFQKKLIIYTDGGSRGNPGPAAFGVVFKDEHGTILKKYGETLGVRTNNEAEYEAVVFAFRKATQLYGSAKLKNTAIEIRMDSQLAVEQLSGRYKIENAKLQPLFMKIWNLQVELGRAAFVYIPREQNKDADRMVNEALDRAEQQKLL